MQNMSREGLRLSTFKGYLTPTLEDMGVFELQQRKESSIFQ